MGWIGWAAWAALGAVDTVTIGVFGAVAGCYVCIVGVVWKVFEHVYQKDRHPAAKDIVFRDVCEARHKGMDNTWQAELSAMNMRIDDLKGEMQRGFAHLEGSIKASGQRKG